MSQLVAIVGRPNVGKSPLFNRLTETRQAIVDPTAGTTRDRQYGKVEWCGREFSIVDTGGWVVNSDDIFEGEINKQVELAIEQADEILFVVDAMNGVTDLDDHVAEILRKSRKPVILVANKVDSNDWLYNVPEFYSLGLGDPYPVSAINGYSSGDLLDEIVKKLPEPTDEEADLEEIPRFAIVGRPNAGKSSLINAFIGEDRHIVTDIAGTTRDSIYTRYTDRSYYYYSRPSVYTTYRGGHSWRSNGGKSWYKGRTYSSAHKLTPVRTGTTNHSGHSVTTTPKPSKPTNQGHTVTAPKPSTGTASHGRPTTNKKPTTSAGKPATSRPSRGTGTSGSTTVKPSGSFSGTKPVRSTGSKPSTTTQKTTPTKGFSGKR